MDSNIERDKRVIWQGFENTFRFPISATCKAYIEKTVCGVHDQDGLDCLRTYLSDVSPIVKDVLTRSSNRQPDDYTVSRKERYNKPLQSRVYLVTWVTTHSSPGQRIDWQELTPMWNREYPNELMTPAMFSSAYHHAKKDEDVQREYAKRQHTEYAQSIERLASVTNNRPLAREELWTGLGKAILFKGAQAAATTMQFTVANFSPDSFMVGGTKPARATEGER